jgi:hypothetical protein
MRSVSPKCLVRPVNLLHLYQEPYIVNQMSRSRDCDLFKEYRRKAFDDFCNLLRETRSKYPQSIGYFEYGNPYREIGVCREAVARRSFNCIHA